MWLRARGQSHGQKLPHLCVRFHVPHLVALRMLYENSKSYNLKMNYKRESSKVMLVCVYVTFYMARQWALTMGNLEHRRYGGPNLFQLIKENVLIMNIIGAHPLLIWNSMS